MTTLHATHGSRTVVADAKSRPSSALDRIIEHKRLEIRERRRARPAHVVREVAELAPPPRGFANRIERDRPAVIAEIKRASPSEGVIRESFAPAAIAESYAAAGASCLSVLTDLKFFQGSDAYLGEARQACALPALRKDFIVNAYQIYETRALGADCLLLIVAALEQNELADLHALSVEIGLDVLVEVHDRAELDRALSLEPRLVGINNRDLRDFTTRLSTTVDLLDAIPASVTVVSESGIGTTEDVRLLREAGVHAFLVGTAFMREADPGAALKRLFRDWPA